MDKQASTYSKRVIEIADYIFANPGKRREDVSEHFCTKLNRKRTTVHNLITRAQKYNTERLNKQEKAKDRVLVESAESSIKRAIISRNEGLEILSKIAMGGARKIGGDIITPSDSERVRAVQQISKMEGWEAPSKTEISGADGRSLFEAPPFLTKAEAKELMDEIKREIG